MLKVNEEKTELLFISTKQQLSKWQLPSIKFGEANVTYSVIARNLGVTFDCLLNMDEFVNTICHSVSFHLYNIWRIRDCLDMKTAEKVIHAVVSSKLDYCNSLLYGLFYMDARPACPRHWHRDPRTPSRWTSARLHAARLAPMYPGMAHARTPPLKICTTSLTWSPILYVPAPHAPPETQALLPSRSTGADGRPVLGPDLGQVTLPPGPPGQTGARSWAPTWARSPCPPVHRGRRAPGPGPRPGPGRLAPRSTGADRLPVLGPYLGQVALPPGTPGQTGARSWAPTWARSPCPPVHRGRRAPGPGPRPGPGRLAPRSTGADRRPVLGPDLGQVALPPGTPGQTGARSWAPTWARSPCTPVHRGRPAPGPGPRPGPGRLAPRSTGADGRPVLGPDLGQVALPPGPPGQTGARSWATTWARALAPRSTGADGRPVLSHDLGQGEVWGPGGGRPAERWRGLMPEHRVEAFWHLCCRLVWHAADRCPGITVTTVLTFFGNVPSGGADWSPRRYLYNGSFLEMHEI